MTHPAELSVVIVYGYNHTYGGKISIGLDNLGNSCYLNSTIQCLRAVLESESVVAISGFSQSRVATSFSALIEYMRVNVEVGTTIAH